MDSVEHYSNQPGSFGGYTERPSAVHLERSPLGSGGTLSSLRATQFSGKTCDEIDASGDGVIDRQEWELAKSRRTTSDHSSVSSCNTSRKGPLLQQRGVYSLVVLQVPSAPQEEDPSGMLIGDFYALHVRQVTWGSTSADISLDTAAGVAEIWPDVDSGRLRCLVVMHELPSAPQTANGSLGVYEWDLGPVLHVLPGCLSDPSESLRVFWPCDPKTLPPESTQLAGAEGLVLHLAGSEVLAALVQGVDSIASRQLQELQNHNMAVDHPASVYENMTGDHPQHQYEEGMDSRQPRVGIVRAAFTEELGEAPGGGLVRHSIMKSLERARKVHQIKHS